MKTLTKMLILFVLVLSLSILTHPQPGECDAYVTGLTIEGTMLNPTTGFVEYATVNLSFDKIIGPLENPTHWIGKMNIKAGDDQDKPFYDKIIDYQWKWDWNKMKIDISTKGGVFGDGSFTQDSNGDLSSLTFTLKWVNEAYIGDFESP